MSCVLSLHTAAFLTGALSAFFTYPIKLDMEGVATVVIAEISSRRLVSHLMLIAQLTAKVIIIRVKDHSPHHC